LSDATNHSKPIEQFDPYHQRQLLTGKRVHQCLEDGQKARWLHASESNSERLEPPVAFGNPIPVVQINICTQKEIESGTDRLALRPSP
jgi:hypothetical protein